jgi:hypothetical protein
MKWKRMRNWKKTLIRKRKRRKRIQIPNLVASITGEDASLNVRSAKSSIHVDSAMIP